MAVRTNDVKIGFRIVGRHPSYVGGMEDEIMSFVNELYAENPNVDRTKIYIAEDVLYE